MLLFARPWLPALLIFATVLQGGSVLNVTLDQGQYGISPYNVTALAALCVLAARLFRAPRLDFLSAAPRPASWLLSLYALVAVTGAFVLPHVHAGVPVYLLLNPQGFDLPPTPLHFTISNAVQAANLCVHLAVALFLLHAASRPDWRSARLLWGLGAAVALVTLIGGYERLAHVAGWPSFNAFWMSNPGYLQLANHDVAGIRRIVAPFSEASYASAFLAAVWTALFAVFLLGRRHAGKLIVAMIVVGLALLNPLGSTGWAAAGVASAAVLLVATVYAAKDSACRARVVSAWAALTVAGAALLLVANFTPAGKKVQELASTAIIDKLDSGSAQSRTRSNMSALTIVSHTYGTGAGMGSNRASSYFASLVSNTGLPGLLTFCGMLAALALAVARSARDRSARVFVVTALGTATLAVALAIPDLNAPLYWAFIFIALAYSARPPEPADGHAANEARHSRTV
ncbi:hypothetical protein [Pseudazoarcus pumilus]|uniref:hypothetical protein n=1 Tax=Pseudazoarcus pumilus TaxID=2067960 RepID=UPI000F5051EB|nr:hypothetical protein [Pseudazoarcus pumilus]